MEKKLTEIVNVLVKLQLRSEQNFRVTLRRLLGDPGRLCNGRSFIVTDEHGKTEIEVIRDVLHIGHVVELRPIERQQRLLLGNEAAVELQLTHFQALRSAHAGDGVARVEQRDGDVTEDCDVQWNADFALGRVIKSEMNS